MKIFNPFQSAIGAGIATFVVALVLLGAFYFNGFWFDENLRIVRTGNITISSIDADTRLFIDNRQKSLTNDNGTIIIKRLLPGVHGVLIAKEGYWPWLKDVVVEEQGIVLLTPFFVNKNPDGVLVTSIDEQFEAYQKAIKEITLPTQDSKKISESGNVAIWTIGSTVAVEWLGDENNLPQFFCSEGFCEPIFIAFVSQEELRNVDFFENREDVLMIASATSVFAVEIDQRGTQNFQPIYSGHNPQFKILEDGLLIVVDNDFVFEVTL